MYNVYTQSLILFITVYILKVLSNVAEKTITRPGGDVKMYALCSSMRGGVLDPGPLNGQYKVGPKYKKTLLDLVDLIKQ